MNNLTGKIKLYWLSIVFSVCSFIVTRGQDGHVFFFVMSFSALAVVYCIFMLVNFNTKFTFHSIGHFMVFPIACMLGYCYSSLEEMAGALYFYIPAAAMIIVVTGAVFLFLARYFSCNQSVSTKH